jgi:8-oxo-dGTP pyrophosphatase MutT (NUDIX family)
MSIRGIFGPDFVESVIESDIHPSKFHMSEDYMDTPPSLENPDYTDFSIDTLCKKITADKSDMRYVKINRSKAFTILIRIGDTSGLTEPEILIVRESYGEWGFPGGGIEKHENPEDCAVREWIEEVGKKYPRSDYHVHSTFQHEKSFIHLFTCIVKSKYIHNTTKFNGEIREVRWIQLSKLISIAESQMQFRICLRNHWHHIIGAISYAILGYYDKHKSPVLR